MTPRSRLSLVTAVLAVLAGALVATTNASASAAPGFVDAQGGSFVLNGQPFKFGGTNNYYLHYKSRAMVDDVFADAAAMDLKVVRAWSMIDMGSLDGTVPNVDGPGHKDGYYLQYWDPAAGKPAVNTGATGLRQLDYMLAAAGRQGIKLIMVLTNNWKEFGGMDQYVRWRGGQHHDQFYTDATIKGWYKNWATTLINRTNTITGVKYKDDPAIFAWELANEPRCSNGNLGSSGTCTTQTIVDWAAEMSTFVKSQDPNHMVSVGDEGFLRWNQGDWPYNAGEGVDHEALTSLPGVDFGTYHLYPNHWGKSAEWGTQWIRDHNTAASGYGKPVILEEFGIQDQGTRDAIYQTWTDTVRTGGGDGWNFWILTGVQDDGSLYPDYDGFRVITPSDTATVLKDSAVAIGGAPDPSPSPTVSPTTSPTPPVGACSVSYRLSDWGSSFNAEVTIRNNGAAVIDGWTLGFAFPAAQTINSIWNAKATQSGQQVTVTSESWTASIPAGGTVSFGLSGTSTQGTNGVPATFTLDDTTCTTVA